MFEAVIAFSGGLLLAALAAIALIRVLIASTGPLIYRHLPVPRTGINSYDYRFATPFSNINASMFQLISRTCVADKDFIEMGQADHGDSLLEVSLPSLPSSYRRFLPRRHERMFHRTSASLHPEVCLFQTGRIRTRPEGNTGWGLIPSSAAVNMYLRL